jgi:hypothetical protein
LVVQIAPELKLFTLPSLEVSACRMGAFGLQGTAEPEVACFELSAVLLPEECVV